MELIIDLILTWMFKPQKKKKKKKKKFISTYIFVVVFKIIIVSWNFVIERFIYLIFSAKR